MSADAVFSEDGVYRYALSREWLGGKGRCLFICLNPSTADATTDDPTVRRCIRYAGRWGYTALDVGNLFAFRATDPDDMLDANDPIGPENDAWLRRLATDALLIVAAWGTHGKYQDRDREVLALIKSLGRQAVALGETAGGFPQHPLYQPRDAMVAPYTGRARAA